MRYSRSLTETNRHGIVWSDGTPAMKVARSSEFMRVFDAIHKARCEIQNTPYRPLDPTWQAVSLPIKTSGYRPRSDAFSFRQLDTSMPSSL